MEDNAELAAQFEALKTAGTELDGLQRIEAQVKPNADIIYSIRFNRGEMDRISDFAKAHDMKVSSFIRQATLAAVEGNVGLEDMTKAAALKEVREHARALAEAANRL